VILSTPWNEVWVVDAGLQRIFRWSTTGRELGSFGGEGEGPGEFLSAGVASVVGDSAVVVHDRRLRRLSMFSRSGQFLKSWPFPVSTRAHGWVSSILVRNDTVLFSAERAPDPGRGGSESGIWKVVLGEATPERFVRLEGTAYSFGRVENVHPTVRHVFEGWPFFGTKGTTAEPEFIYAHAGAEAAVKFRMAPQGFESESLPYKLPRKPVTDELRESARDSLVALFHERMSRARLGPTLRRRLERENERLWRTALEGDSLPRFSRFASDGRGALYMRDVIDPTVWHRQQPDGSVTAVGFPVSLSFLTVTLDGRAYGIHLDENRVGSIWAFR
jgi:hypothetical protein